MSYVKDLSDLIEARKGDTLRISDQVWEYAESRFQEFKSSAAEAE